MMPTNKVTAGALAGGVSILIAWFIKQYTHVDMPAEVSIAMSTVITFVVQYIVPDAPKPSTED